MIRLSIDNSRCKIEGLSFQYLRALRNDLSVTQFTGRFIKTKTGKSVRERETKYLMTKTGEFPTGLLYMVDRFLDAQHLTRTVERVDRRIIPPGHRETHLTLERSFEPYPEQLEAAQAAYDAGRGIISAPTGVGKSAIVAEIIALFRLKTLVVVPGLSLKTQLTETLRKGFGRRKVGSFYKRCDIAVANVDELKTDAESMAIIKEYDLVIIDEFHHAAAETYRELNDRLWAKIYYKIGLTATPWRANDSERLLLESVLSHLIYEIPYRLAVDKGYIVPMEAYYYDLPELGPEPEKKEGKFSTKKATKETWHEVYKRYVVEREDRNKLISNLMTSLMDQGQSVLVLTKQIAHGKTIQDATGAPFAEGANDCNAELLAQFNAREILGLVGTVGVMGEGTDSKAAEWIVLAGGGKSKVQFFQNIGRGFRRFPGKETCKIILFKDISHPWLVKHFDACVQYLREEFDCEPVKLDFPNAT